MENFIQGLGFMVIGISVVFMFLIVLLIAMNMLKLVITKLNKFFPEPEEAKTAQVSKNNNQDIAVAIAAAYSMKNKG